METFPITPRQIMLLALFGGVFAFVAAASLRKAQQLPFFRRKFPDAQIQQNWISGASSLGLMGTLAQANNCLWFVLTSDTLYVGAHFPFNMFIPRFIADLDLRIPLAAISSVSEKSRHSVRVEYEVTDATRGMVRTEYLDLWPRRGDHFFNILHEKARVARERGAI